MKEKLEFYHKYEKMIKVSIIIPTYNKYERLKLVLCSLENQTYNKELFEVIIVDDGSTDDTKKITNRDYSFNLYYMRQNNNGRSAARNKGLENATYSTLVFIDDDTVLSPYFIEEHVKQQAKAPVVAHGAIREIPYVKFFKDPRKGIFYDIFSGDLSVSRMQKYCISSADIIERFNEKIEKASKISGHEKIIFDIFQKEYSKLYWLGFSGGNVSLPKCWIQDIGGFDECYKTNWGCEDIDVGYRLLQKKYPFTYNMNAVNYHLDHFHLNYVEEHNIGANLFYEKFEDNNIFLLQKFVQGEIKSEEFIKRVNTKQ